MGDYEIHMILLTQARELINQGSSRKKRKKKPFEMIKGNSLRVIATALAPTFHLAPSTNWTAYTRKLVSARPQAHNFITY